jgi:hypothetical protein
MRKQALRAAALFGTSQMLAWAVRVVVAALFAAAVASFVHPGVLRVTVALIVVAVVLELSAGIGRSLG